MPTFDVKQLQTFRQKFVVPNINCLRWFPGHMTSGMKKMQSKLKSVDCVIELHDARIPFSGRNPNFKRQILGVKPHMFILNKSDLIDNFTKDRVVQKLKEEGVEHVKFVCCKRENSDISEVLKDLVTIIQSTNRFNRQFNREYSAMIIGVPNVGKSSLMNVLRSKCLKKKAVAPVGAKAGITKAVQTRVKVNNNPPVFIYDTPGILTPSIPNVEVGMKLAVCATLNDHNIGYLTMADYLLYWCNKSGNINYMDFFQINEPCDNISLLLANYAISHGLVKTKRLVDGSAGLMNTPDIDGAAQIFVETFRLGRLGPIMLDKDIL